MLHSSLAFAAVAIGINLLFLPLYLLLLFLPPFNLLLFYGINGVLFGREYFELVALRRYDEAEAALVAVTAACGQPNSKARIGTI